MINGRKHQIVGGNQVTSFHFCHLHSRFEDAQRATQGSKQCGIFTWEGIERIPVCQHLMLRTIHPRCCLLQGILWQRIAFLLFFLLGETRAEGSKIPLLLTQHGHKEAFPLSAMREEAIDGDCILGQAPRDAPLLWHLYGQHLCPQLRGYPRHILFVFLRIESAGAVDQQSTWLQAGPDVREDAALALPAEGHILWAPLRDGCLILAEHTFTRTRHIGEYHVEEVFKGREGRGIIARHHRIGTAPLRDVLCQYLSTLWHYLIGYQQAALGQ